MTDRSNQSENENKELLPSGQNEFATRRTVIQGLASVAPVIMTLSSGEALANSSNLHCLKKPYIKPPKCIGKKQSDKWLRKYTKIGKKSCTTKTGGGSKSGWGKSGWGKSGWGSSSKKSCTTKKTTKKCLVYVDESGCFTSKKKGTPITRSCYNSFLPKKKN
jgi:hypothetical protein